MRLHDLMESMDKKAVALAKYLKVDVSEIEKQHQYYNIGKDEWVVYTKSEADKEALEYVLDLLDDIGLEAFDNKFKKKILTMKFVKSSKKADGKELLDFYDEDPDMVEDELVEKGIIDLDKIAKEMVKEDGRGGFLSPYDGKEIKLSGGLLAYLYDSN